MRIKFNNIFYKLADFAKKIGGSLKRFFLILTSWLKIIYLSLNQKEKKILAISFLVIILCLGLLINNKYLANTKLAPNFGGVYTEGVIINSQENVNTLVNRLTKIGLVRFDKDKMIIPALAKKWEISEDQTTYTFELINNVRPNEIIEILKKEKKDWQEQNIEIKNPDEHTLQITLSQPFSPFLASLTEPMFPYGPYKIQNESKKEISFIPREDFYLGKANISEIIIKIYPDETNLNQALKNNELDGVGELASDTILPKNFNKYQMTLPRYLMVFFNTNSPALSDKEIRQKLARGEKLPKEIEFNLVTANSQKNVAKAEELKNKWQAQGAKVNIISKDSRDLQKDVIPNRQYDALLYGLDYGEDPDPYPFWHSSQITNQGLNLSNFADVNADKLLEEARQTTNEDERAKKYQDFQKILDEEVPAIVLEQITWQHAISSRIKGVISEHAGITPADRFFEVWNWYIKEKRVKK